MALDISYANDVNGSIQRVQGSDGRLNVSARSDGRGYYNSRDEQSVYTLTGEDASSADGDFVLYWKNTATDGRHLVITKIVMWSEGAHAWILHQGNNEVATGGVATTPKNLNLANPKSAPATARTADSSTIATVTAGSEIAHAGAAADEEAHMEFEDTLRIGQDQSILLEAHEMSGTPDKTRFTAFGYYE